MSEGSIQRCAWNESSLVPAATVTSRRSGIDPAPLDAESSCPAARQFSRAYLHHLVKAGEYLAAMVLTFTNVAYYQMLMRGLRDAIEAGRLAETVASLEAGWRDGEA
jgi:queuine tRNA-ribosyltransferase